MDAGLHLVADLPPGTEEAEAQRRLGPGLTVEAFADPSNPAAAWLHLENLAAQ